MKHIHFLTLFPKSFEPLMSESITARAAEKKLVKYHVHDLRQWGEGTRKTVDDKPYGGGPGMVLQVGPIAAALREICQPRSDFLVLVTSAKGERYTQKIAQQFAETNKQLLLICGHYEGIDERVAEHFADGEVSIGEYVLTGGELAAQVIADSVVRLIPGVLGNDDSALYESFSNHYNVERGQYTRPEIFTTEDGTQLKVPDVLLSGHHKNIEEWRKQQ